MSVFRSYEVVSEAILDHSRLILTLSRAFSIVILHYNWNFRGGSSPPPPPPPPPG